LTKSNQIQQLRIIAGHLRGRKIYFNTNNLELRPTLDRLRETVFNWLMPYIQGSSCLDLFAGSGIFGFEAYSRGAKFVTAVEYNHDSYQDILQNKLKLNIPDQKFKLINQDALLFLADIKKIKFNLIFLDPPYNIDQTLLLTSIQLLITNNLLAQNSKIYVETNQQPKTFTETLDKMQLKLIKFSKTNKIYFCLYEFNKFK
jgi:16S rRNA (guanine966-N2)-methyltransferase